MEEDLDVIENTYDDEQDKISRIELEYLSHRVLSEIKKEHTYYMYNKEGKISVRTIVIELNNGNTIELNIKEEKNEKNQNK